MRILALDYGNKRVGVAVSDALGWTAQPLATLEMHGHQELLAEIKEYIDKYEVEEIVVGMPYNMDGTMGKRAEITQAFINFLRNNLELPIQIQDERLTTSQAKNILLEADVSRKGRKKVIDKLAASLILQSYLDSQ
ncbi:putative Holliday junction resolvase [Halanaerobium saccharolyticum]|uniref:Putative pre-16S rRNA nuclease n=1 Tax=Halanaerobium saccharolyticum TaxID=43595 RepID=A0A4R7YYS5_9FIRM|nr:Holliday junction resolvase RuvX [Halanaerobium saccharolyticum]RAK06695.1 putative Holliday junction resolvase [Halanaerobium saccharolyticum]TDW01332.1 putative Holliday junction resolvase [Halanaerobium saccharolyticum]TDX52800.1 putative Holliday junction resolvase [Halanaerobium saccharolyticum]